MSQRHDRLLGTIAGSAAVNLSKRIFNEDKQRSASDEPAVVNTTRTRRRHLSVSFAQANTAAYHDSGSAQPSSNETTPKRISKTSLNRSNANDNGRSSLWRRLAACKSDHDKKHRALVDRHNQLLGLINQEKNRLKQIRNENAKERFIGGGRGNGRIKPDQK